MGSEVLVLSGLLHFLIIQYYIQTPCCRHMLLVISKAKKLLESFSEKNYKKKKKKKKKSKKGFRVEKVIKRKGDKLYVK